MVRSKMPQMDRAKQFASFDALKGLQDALRMKEWEHEKVTKGAVQEEKAREISEILLNLKKGDVVTATFYDKGFYCSATGTAKLDLTANVIYIGSYAVPLLNLFDIKK